MHTAHSLVTDDAYGRDLYMLNRCLEDIEYFERNLRKFLRSLDRHGAEKSTGDTKNTDSQPPNATDTIDALQKVKFALNITEKIRKSLPYLSKEVFVYLIRVVRKVHNSAKEKLIPNYNPNIVVDVIEPLLLESTITSLFKLFTVKTKEFWLELGPSWNTPSSKWPNSLKTYMPTFSQPYKRRRTTQRSSDLTGRQQVFNSRILLKGTPDIDDNYEPHFHGGLRYFRVDDKEYLAYQRYRREVKLRDEHLGEYILPSVISDSGNKKPDETQEHEIKLIDFDTYWTVYDQNRIIGEIPHVKVNCYHHTDRRIKNEVNNKLSSGAEHSRQTENVGQSTGNVMLYYAVTEQSHTSLPSCPLILFPLKTQLHTTQK
ncbi:unnamed protein product [Trichobilharzia szidati]|nr:unnamed protein product [Trichobilharzia szidati]